MDSITELWGLAALPIITALLQGVKVTIPELPSRFYPLAALVLAIAWNVGVGLYLHTDVWLSVIVGFVVGLAASGLYSQAKTLRDG